VKSKFDSECLQKHIKRNISTKHGIETGMQIILILYMRLNGKILQVLQSNTPYLLYMQKFVAGGRSLLFILRWQDENIYFILFGDLCDINIYYRGALYRYAPMLHKSFGQCLTDGMEFLIKWQDIRWFVQCQDRN
jgi:hypothetical protein